jgi:hypothetical protein
MEKKVRDLFERCGRREIFDRIPGDDQSAGFTVYITQARTRRDYAFQAFGHEFIFDRLDKVVNIDS